MQKLFEESKRLREIWGGFRAARVLLTANNYKVFDHLKRPKTAEEVAVALETDRRATEILLDALTGLGLLRKQNGRYSNSPLASKFLVSDSPYYQGDIIKHADILWTNWSGLDVVIRTGRPSRRAFDHESFIRGMHNLAIFKARKVINAIGTKGIKTALDLGGGPGTYAIEMAKKGINVTLFDRPETIGIARDIVGKAGVKGIRFLSGDFLTDEIGRGYDLIFISQVLHSCSEFEILHILRRSMDALNPSGRIVIQEFYINDDRTHPLQSALFSVNMLVNTISGRCYSPSELRGWLSVTGFKDLREKMIDDCVVISGRKTTRDK